VERGGDEAAGRPDLIGAPAELSTPAFLHDLFLKRWLARASL
jgi:hypothetical protein